MHGHCFLQQLVFLLFIVFAGAQGSIQIRLKDGNNRCAGRVEILYQGTWGTICDDEGVAARVVCRQLGCGQDLYYTDGYFFGLGSGPIWLGGLNCTGKESHVWKCPSWGWGPHNCSHTQDAGVICTGFLRLAGQDGLCSGRVEVNPRGRWTPVSDVNFTFPTAQVICAELGCGKAVSVLRNVSRNANEKLWAEEFQCVGQEPELLFCPRAPCAGGSCQHGGAVEVVCSESPQLRLVNGGSRCVGRVEVLHHDSWGTICGYNWDTTEAEIVCRQLSCGGALAAVDATYFGAGSGPIWLEDLRCTGQESHVWKCPSLGWNNTYCSHQEDAGVICSGFVRLAGGEGLCSGRVEVNPGGEWIPVSDRNFTLATAQVICAELECGRAVSVMRDVPFREAIPQVWGEEFRCEGQEPELWFCPRAPCPGGSCQHSGAVKVVCSEFTEVRLTKNSTSQCEGQVEVNTSVGWRALCASHWSMANADVLCHQLGCGVASSTPKGGAYFVEGGGEIRKDRFHCSGAESFLWSCPVTSLGVPACAHENTASVVCSGNQTPLLSRGNDSLSDPERSTASEVQAACCSDSGQLRLVEGGGRCAGRVEILHQGSWGTICDDSWDLSDAHVVCRQLDCGVALNATVSAHFGPGSGDIWLDELNCTGEESHVWKCPSWGWGQHDCWHKEDAGVICSEFLALRVVSEDQECAGWLEVFYNGTWGSVCRSPMEDVTLSMICRQLGCGDSGTLNTSVPPREGPRPRWVDGIRCQKTDVSLWQCPSDPWNSRSCLPKDEAYIMCAGQRPKSCPDSAPCTDRKKLRLQGGDSECSGRVEVWHEGSWGTVCDDSWGLAEAEVVCQQLGCGSALDALGEAAYGSGNGSIWLDEVQCRGRESSLWACARAPWGQSDCKHEEDAGVRCSGEKMTVLSAPTSTSSVSTSFPGNFSLYAILCIILGTLLFLLLIILGTQLGRWRAGHQALAASEDAVNEAVYQEIEYLVKAEKLDLLDNPGTASDDSATKLPYYTGDNEEVGDHESAPEPPGQHVDATGNGYDDVAEILVPEIPSSLGRSEKYFVSEERDAIRQLCSVSQEATLSFMDEKESPLALRQEETGYDDIELDAV
ncbi:PREDICTED: antigen WC1.1-like isoform X2 [Chinchilla lanigera]|uniref:antigen WC1.1-like isoform X2 n=1 Tax=Chinchilla lanigera TaxID=34839 RepID=UPI00038EA2AE|nr:PREDICTED: antigen WC1.1-like isoform X2 [Chinchilla lanigera]